MSTTSWVILAVAVALLVAVVAAVAVARQRRHRQELARRFGPEYDRAVEQHGPRGAERELDQRLERHEQLTLHGLTPPEREAFGREWAAVQTRFVDEPVDAVADAERLVRRVMLARGYPVGDGFDQQAADLSVEHADLMDRYRQAHDAAAAGRDGQATTEELRRAMVHYRAMATSLLGLPSEAADRDAMADPIDLRDGR